MFSNKVNCDKEIPSHMINKEHNLFKFDAEKTHFTSESIN